mmetsp:Transcript_8248/g.17453  ORF Transcript_8248/g.17453 Transcript_8248/m.17453 type:complete len:253 (-) Transcript_8248:57-815(-)
MLFKRSKSARTASEDRASKERCRLEDLMNTRDWDTVRSLLNTHKGAKALKKSDNYDMPHLFLAIAQDAPADLLMKLVNINPTAVSHADEYCRLPLHIACSNGAPAEVIDVLLKKNNSTALCRDSDGRLPLHYAVEYCVSTLGHEYLPHLDSISRICAAAPEAVFQGDAWNDTPEDIAAEAETLAKLESDPEVESAAKAVKQTLRRSSASRKDHEVCAEDQGDRTKCEDTQIKDLSQEMARQILLQNYQKTRS